MEGIAIKPDVEKNIEVIYEKTNRRLANTTNKRALTMIKKKKAVWIEKGKSILLKQKYSDVKRIKEEFIEENEKICYLCGDEILTEKRVSIDHIIAKAKYGQDKKINYALAHKKCNVLKGKKTIKELIDEDIFELTEERKKELLELEKEVSTKLNIVIN